MAFKAMQFASFELEILTAYSANKAKKIVWSRILSGRTCCLAELTLFQDTYAIILQDLKFK